MWYSTSTPDELTSSLNISRKGDICFIWIIDHLSWWEGGSISHLAGIKDTCLKWLCFITRTSYNMSFSIDWQDGLEEFIRKVFFCHSDRWCYITITWEYDSLIIIISKCSFKYIESNIYICLFFLKSRKIKISRANLDSMNSRFIFWIDDRHLGTRKMSRHLTIIPVDNTYTIA